jgi:hypothetical protein
MGKLTAKRDFRRISCAACVYGPVARAALHSRLWTIVAQCASRVVWRRHETSCYLVYAQRRPRCVMASASTQAFHSVAQIPKLFPEG